MLSPFFVKNHPKAALLFFAKFFMILCDLILRFIKIQKMGFLPPVNFRIIKLCSDDKKIKKNLSFQKVITLEKESLVFVENYPRTEIF